MLEGWAVEGAEHGFLRWRLIEVWVRSEDDIPLIVDLVHFRRPDVGRVVKAWGRGEDEFRRGGVPVAGGRLGNGWKVNMGEWKGGEEHT